jgi:peptide/nickel transport system permease protein
MGFFMVVFRRVAYAVLLLLSVLILNFMLIQLAPGDPAQVIAGEMGGVTEEQLARIRAAYGLDRSLPEQLAVYLGRVLQGDLGFSFYFNRPVIDLITSRIPATLLLVVTALLLAIGIGTLLGVLASRKPNGIFSQMITVLALFGFSVPVFWIGIMLLILFSGTLRIFPVSGMQSVTLGDANFVYVMLDILHHLVLPAFTLAIVYIAQYSRLARASMLETLGSDYIRTARAKGLPERRVIFRHALRNAILPVVTMAGLQFSQLFAGAVLVETVFNWPGMGRLAFESILRRDYPTLLGILFFSAVIVIVVNLLTDIVYRLADPRIKSAR